MEYSEIGKAFKKLTVELTILSGRIYHSAENLKSAVSWEKDETIKAALKEIVRNLEITYKKANDLTIFSDDWCKEVERVSNKQMGFF